MHFCGVFNLQGKEEEIMKWSFNEYLGLILALILLYLLAYRSVPEQAQGAFIAALTLIVNYFFRKAKKP